MESTDDVNNVELLMSMGFGDIAEVKRALKMAKNDMNEAVSLLTNETPGLYDVEMVDGPSTSSSSSTTDGSHGKDSLEFPTTHLYELESRVFVKDWSIPYRREESLGRCLLAAINLAGERLAESDDSCRRFMDSCLPAAFDKLLNSHMTPRWTYEIQEGIYTMLQLFVDLIATRLTYEPVPHRLLEVLGQAFDPRSEYHQKNRSRGWDRSKWENEFGSADRAFAVPSLHGSYSQSQTYGYLVNLVNQFAAKKGFDSVAKCFESDYLNCQDIHHLLYPFAMCAAYLNPDVVTEVLEPCVKRARVAVDQLNDVQLKKPASTFAVDALCSAKLIACALWAEDDGGEYDSLRLSTILRLLKSSHFACRMQALREITKLLEWLASSRHEKLVIKGEVLSEWLTENNVLSLALEGNIDQVQYCDRLKTLMEFLGPRMSCADINKIWLLQKNRTAVTVENLHTMIAQAAVKFQEKEMNYLMALIEKSWTSETTRGREKLLVLVGRIGKETTSSKTYSKALEVVWKFAHEAGLSATLCEIALHEHFGILSQAGREAERNDYVMQCVEDIKKKRWVLPALWHVTQIIQSMPKTSFSTSVMGTRSTTRNNYLKEFLQSTDFVKLLVECLVERHQQVHQAWRKDREGSFVTPLASPMKQQLSPVGGEGAQRLTVAVNTMPARFASTPVAAESAAPSLLAATLQQLPTTLAEELPEEYVMADGYQYGLCVKAILDFLKSTVVDSQMSINAQRIREIWEVLIEDSYAAAFEKELGLDWFIRMIDDCERTSLFTEKILKLEPATLTPTGFRCFRKYFEEVNVTQKSLRKSIMSAQATVVDNLHLTGLDFVWQTIINCLNGEIVDDAMSMLMDLMWRNLNEKLKKDAKSLHEKFLEECYRQLEAARAVLNLDGSVVARLIQHATRLLTAPSMPEVAGLPPPSRQRTVQSMERVLCLAQRYIRTVDEQYDGARFMLPHSASFFGKPFPLGVKVELTLQPLCSPKEFTIMVHENEQLFSLRERLAERLKLDVKSVLIELDGDELRKTQDQVTLRRLAFSLQTKLVVKSRCSTPFIASYDSQTGSSEIRTGSSLSISASTSNMRQSAFERERTYPSTMMANDSEVFERLYSLASIDNSIMVSVRNLLLLIPSDRSVSDLLDSLGSANTSASSSKSNSLERSIKRSGGSNTSEKATVGRPSTASPKLPGKHAGAATATCQSATSGSSTSINANDECASGRSVLQRLFEVTPFKLLYNLEVLSGKLLPVGFDTSTLLSAQTFCKHFLAAGGLSCLLNVLQKDYIPAATEYVLRLEIYERVLQILRYLLVNESAMREIVVGEKSSHPCEEVDAEKTDAPNECASTSTKSVQVVAASAVAAAAVCAPVLVTACESSMPQSFAVTTLSDTEFFELLSLFQRLIWAAASSSLHMLVTADLLSPQSGTFAGSFRSRTSESSTASTGSSDTDVCPSSLHAAIWSPTCVPVSEADANVANACLSLLVECCCSRPECLEQFFKLQHLSDFLVDLLLANNETVRKCALASLLKFVELADQQMSGVAESPVLTVAPKARFHVGPQFSPPSSVEHMLVEESQRSTSSPLTGASTRLVLLQILLRVPLPLWTSSSLVRGNNQRLLAHCSEYFQIRGRLIESLKSAELQSLSPSAATMLQDEVNWLLGFVCSANPDHVGVDNTLIAAHMTFMGVLVKVQPHLKRKFGQQLVSPLLNEFLFPASRLIVDAGAEQASLRQAKAANMRAKCQKMESRAAAFDLLLELANGCPENYASIISILYQLHHQYSPDLAKEWDYMPLVDSRMDAGFVGLKNAGATCYMNSILQQFFMEPGVAQTLLGLDVSGDDDSLLYQLQFLFANLQESDLQYFTPKKFWESFRLDGKPVNPREQQDAFEFYTGLIDQIDQLLEKQHKEAIFKRKYQGVFSDQKICKECPHRYEREEPFYALNVPVRVQTLEESLNQFVKGEILEGENAYFCEKCEVKRTTMKRMCVKTLPPVLVIHLKRFNFDFEENRALKFNDFLQFPLTLDMFPYTASGLSKLESDDDVFASPLPTVAEGGNASLSSALSATQLLSSSPGSASALTASPLALSRKFSGVRRTPGARGHGDNTLYELVGVVVHSGQANAGHYYSFIKDRRDDPLLNKHYGKWFKFNDTTVEEVEMTPQFMETELFGGKYFAKTDKNSTFTLPEERERYWNSYILLYGRAAPAQRESRMSHRPTTSTLTPKRAMSFGVTSQDSPLAANASRRDSLMELTELVAASERQHLFSGDAIAARIRQQIREENLRFARDRDVFNEDYTGFVRNLVRQAVKRPLSDAVANEQGSVHTLEFTVNYLLNTLWHMKRSLRSDVYEWLSTVRSLVTGSSAACAWLVSFLASPTGLSYLEDFLLNAVADIRTAFGDLLKCLLVAHDGEGAGAAFDRFVLQLLSLLDKHVIDTWQNSAVYFAVLYSYAQQGEVACRDLLLKNAFRLLLSFLLQYPPAPSGAASASPPPRASPSTAPPLVLSRRWSLSQSRDFNVVYNILGTLILHCDVSKYRTATSAPSTPPLGASERAMKATVYEPMTVQSGALLAMPKDMEAIVFGDLSSGFVKELVWAAANVEGTLRTLVDLVLYCSCANERFSKLVIREALFCCAQNQSNELKCVFNLLSELLAFSDALQAKRTEWLIDGFRDDKQPVGGILSVIRSSCTQDSRRSYNCVKFLVATSSKCEPLKDALNKRVSDWHWAVDWLRATMDGENGTTSGSEKNTTLQSTTSGSTVYGPSVAPPVASNEDSTTRSFQRTASAQYTLDRAKALLLEFQADDDEDAIDDDAETSGVDEMEISAGDDALGKQRASVEEKKAGQQAQRIAVVVPITRSAGSGEPTLTQVSPRTPSDNGPTKRSRTAASPTRDETPATNGGNRSCVVEIPPLDDEGSEGRLAPGERRVPIRLVLPPAAEAGATATGRAQTGILRPSPTNDQPGQHEQAASVEQQAGAVSSRRSNRVKFSDE